MFHKTLAVLFCSACAVIIISGCNSKCMCTAPQTKIISENDTGKTIDLKSGQTVDIQLNENRTTGYQWQYSCSNMKTCVIAKDTFLPPTGTGIVGASGTRQFTVKAASAGTANITFKYVRPWEKNKKTAKEIVYKIVVK